MKKSLLTILSSFFGIGFVLMLGTNIFYRKNIIPATKRQLSEEIAAKDKSLKNKEKELQDLKTVLDITNADKRNVEEELRELKTIVDTANADKKDIEKKLQEEIAQQEANAQKNAKLAAEAKTLLDTKATAKKARQSAKKKSSKKSKAS